MGLMKVVVSSTSSTRFVMVSRGLTSFGWLGSAVGTSLWVASVTSGFGMLLSVVPGGIGAEG